MVFETGLTEIRTSILNYGYVDASLESFSIQSLAKYARNQDELVFSFPSFVSSLQYDPVISFIPDPRPSLIDAYTYASVTGIIIGAVIAAFLIVSGAIFSPSFFCVL